MSARSTRIFSSTRRTQALLAGCAISALLQAAALAPALPELDEVQVTAKVAWPIEDYVEFPRFDSVVISPGGKQLATGWSEESYYRRVNVTDLSSMQLRSSRLLQLYFGVTDLRWLDEDRLLIQPDWPLPGFRRLREPLGTMLVADLDGGTLELNPIPPQGAPTTVVPGSGAGGSAVDPADLRSMRGLNALAGLRLVEQIARQKGDGGGPLAFGPVRSVSSPGQPDQLLFQTMWTGDADKGGYGVFQLDLANCRQVRVATLPLRGGQAITDANGKPALVSGVNEADEHVVYFLPEEARSQGTRWELRVRSVSGERSLLPLAWTGQDERYYALDGRDLPTRAVVVWNARDNSRQVLYRHGDADIDSAAFDPAGKPWMFSGISQYPVYWYPDPTHPLAQLHNALAQRLPREQVDIVSSSDDLATAVVRVSSGARPTIFLVVDVKTGSSLTSMNTYPKLRGRRISPVSAIEFTARDGLGIRGYLTTPLDQEGKPRHGVPLLVIAHDGPSGEIPDYRHVADPRYDFERQLFASRGYAVLQVNTRGTGGRGRAFQQAGEGEWGAAVQDDFADAVKWAISEGVAAPGRTCFYGTGYGAYSAMMAAAREPDLFQCVIGVAGVYDLPGLVQRGSTHKVTDLAILLPAPGQSICPDMTAQITKDVLRPRSFPNSEVRKAVEALDGRKGTVKEIPYPLRRAIGNDPEKLRARSPVSHASTIKAKVLLVNQFRDRISEDQLDSMRSALRVARNPPQTAVIGDENGGYYEGYFIPQMRADAYKLLLRFLERQIGK